MDISLPLRRGEADNLTSASTNIKHLLKKWHFQHWNLSQLKQCNIIFSLLLRYFPLLRTPTKRKPNVGFTLFICLLLTNHVVVANHLRRHSQNNLNANSSGDSTRRSRTAGQNGASTFILRPEFLTIPIGGVIHLFPRYGYLSLSMKVIARNNSNANSASNAPVRNESWIFLEPVNNVIEPSTLRIEETTLSPMSDSDALPFHNLFHFDLCEDINALMEAYFKNFSIEGLDKPWQAFAGGWRSASIARNFGIEQQFVDGDYRFILVKVLLVRGTGNIETIENTTASQGYASNFLRFKPDNDLSTYEFFKVVGTHYIHSYIIGNAIYQVFVYDPDGFQAVKRQLLFDGIKAESTAGSAEPILESLSGWVRHIGRVIILNAEAHVTEAVREALVTESSNPSPSLLKLHDNPSLVKQIETLLANQPNGILGIDLRGIQFLFTDAIQRRGFVKALKHKMQLWEINFLY